MHAMPLAGCVITVFGPLRSVRATRHGSYEQTMRWAEICGAGTSITSDRRTTKPSRRQVLTRELCEKNAMMSPPLGLLPGTFVEAIITL